MRERVASYGKRWQGGWGPLSGGMVGCTCRTDLVWTDSIIGVQCTLGLVHIIAL